MPRKVSLLLWLLLLLPAACGSGTQGAPAEPPGVACVSVESGSGPAGTVPVRAETVAAGLEVPWGIGFLPNGDLLVTERPGRVRLVRDGVLREEPVAMVDSTRSGESGLLGIAISPTFAGDHRFYLYYTTSKAGTPVNRIERWRVAGDGLSATRDRVILDDLPAASLHDGGRLRFGPDGMLYASVGDARVPDAAPRRESLAGKLLRVTPDGQAPPDNPIAGSAIFLLGLRNSQGFDWRTPSVLWVADHGPSGEFGRRGQDEVTVARRGDDLGWPVVSGCDTAAGTVSPALTWRQAVPPGGAAVYTGDEIPEWRGSLMIGSLGAKHLHRVVFDDTHHRVVRHEVYFPGDPPAGLGRLRDVVMSPGGELYVTTSNCDGRGVCPPEKDKVLRIRRGS